MLYIFSLVYVIHDNIMASSNMAENFVSFMLITTINATSEFNIAVTFFFQIRSELFLGLNGPLPYIQCKVTILKLQK